MRRRTTNHEVEVGTFDENTGAHFDLERIDPRALLVVMTDVVAREGGFTTGEQLRENWENPKIQRVSSSYHDLPVGWYSVTCPDQRRMFVKFTSTRYQLLDDCDQQTPVGGEDTMTPETTETAPAAGATPAVTPPVPHKAPPKKTKAPAKVKPVKQSAKAAAAPKKAPKAAPTGNYKWLLHRLKAQALGALATDANRHTLREGMKPLESYSTVRTFLNRSGVKIETIEAFLDKFFDASINR